MTPIQQLQDKFSHQVYYSCDREELDAQVDWCTQHLVRGSDWEWWMEYTPYAPDHMRYVFGFIQAHVALEFRLSF